MTIFITSATRCVQCSMDDSVCQQYAAAAAVEDVEVEFAEAGAESVSDGSRGQGRAKLASFQRILGVAGEFRFRKDHLARIRSEGRAGGEAPTAYGNPDLIQRSAVLQHFQCCRAGAGDDVRVVIGRHEHRAGFLHDSCERGCAGFERRFALHDGGAVAFDGGSLGGAGVTRHNDDCVEARPRAARARAAP